MAVFNKLFPPGSGIIYGSGIACFVPLCWLCVLSLPVLRRHLYELFSILHAPVGYIYIGLLFWHTKNFLMSWDYLFASIAIIVICNMWRFCKLNWSKPWRRFWSVTSWTAIRILPYSPCQLFVYSFGIRLTLLLTQPHQLTPVNRHHAAQTASTYSSFRGGYTRSTSPHRLRPAIHCPCGASFSLAHSETQPRPCLSLEGLPLRLATADRACLKNRPLSTASPAIHLRRHATARPTSTGEPLSKTTFISTQYRPPALI
jgi:hypothetical protein